MLAGGAHGDNNFGCWCWYDDANPSLFCLILAARAGSLGYHQSDKTAKTPREVMVKQRGSAFALRKWLGESEGSYLKRFVVALGGASLLEVSTAAPRPKCYVAERGLAHQQPAEHGAHRTCARVRLVRNLLPTRLLRWGGALNSSCCWSIAERCSLAGLKNLCVPDERRISITLLLIGCCQCSYSPTRWIRTCKDSLHDWDLGRPSKHSWLQKMDTR